jgi:hypothetical protein
MVKKLSALALAGLLAMPVAASAGGGGDLAARIDQLTRELNALKAEMNTMKEDQEDAFEELDEKSEGWDMASRFKFSGDIRSRLDYHSAETADYYKASEVASGITSFTTAQPTMAGMLPGLDLNADGTTTVGEMSTALGGLMLNAGVPDLATWQTNLDNPLTATADSPFTDAQEEALFFMMTDPEVGAMFAAWNAFPATAVTDAMATPEALAGLMKNLSPAARASIFNNMGYTPTPSADYENDTLWTTRLRMNMRVKATENVEVKARVVAYKAWGMQDSPMPETNEDGIHDTNSPYFLNSRTFDGTASRQPGDNKLVLDRAFMNWNNIGGMPVWFSIGRRPTTDGPPAHLRLGVDKRMATPVNYMDYPFDGFSLGYAYNTLFGMEDFPGRIRFCYGRGFEAGPNEEDSGINDVDFAGLSWDVYKKGYRFMNIQSFGAFNLFNVPGDTYFPNPLELAQQDAFDNGETLIEPNNTYLDRTNMGNLWHTSAVYMDRVENLNYFVTLGWSRTDPEGVDEMGISLLNDFWNEPEDKDGYGVYVGARYDLEDLPLKFGAEYNYGSKNWLAFTPGHDDMYSSKLQTRGSVYEVYAIYDLPVGEAISKYGKVFMRLGYQHYDYDYTYSGMWLGTPTKIDDIKDDPLSAQFYAPIEEMDNIYLTVEGHF